MNIKQLKNKLNQKQIVILDGATGTEIQRRGVKTTLPLWSASALLTNPGVVKQIHKDYIAQGAEIITTDTFRTTRRTLKKANIEDKAKEITILACKLAHDAVSESKKNVYVAGSIAPLEDCYSPQLTPPEQELKKEHEEYAADLADGKVDFILIETMITLRETKAALEAAKKTGLPLAVTFCIGEDGNLLGGESLEDAVKLSEKYHPLFIGINCIDPKIVESNIKRLKKLTKIPLSAYAHGSGQPADDEGWKFDPSDKGEDYVSYAKKWVEAGAQVIGGCCGTTPDYTETLSKYFVK